jgi:hypothetical protein
MHPSITLLNSPQSTAPPHSERLRFRDRTRLSSRATRKRVSSYKWEDGNEDFKKYFLKKHMQLRRPATEKDNDYQIPYNTVGLLS